MRIASFFVALAALGGASAVQAETIVLKPTSDWVLDYAEDKCRLARTFGEGDGRTVLIFDQYGPAKALEAIVRGSALKPMRSRRTIEAQYGPYFQPRAAAGQNRSLGGYGDALLLYGIGNPPEREIEPGGTAPGEEAAVEGMGRLDPQDGARIEWLDLQQGPTAVRLNIGNLEAPYKALNGCVDDLIAHWGFDPVEQRSVARAARLANGSELLRSQIWPAYPTSAIRAGQEAVIYTRVMLDAEGRPTDCVLINATATRGFDSTLCQIMMRHARYEAAQDADGQAIASFYVGRAHYSLPR